MVRVLGPFRLKDPRYELWEKIGRLFRISWRLGEGEPRGKKGNLKDALQNKSVLGVVLNFLGAFQKDLKPRATRAAGQNTRYLGCHVPSRGSKSGAI